MFQAFLLKTTFKTRTAKRYPLFIKILSTLPRPLPILPFTSKHSKISRFISADIFFLELGAHHSFYVWEMEVVDRDEDVVCVDWEVGEDWGGRDFVLLFRGMFDLCPALFVWWSRIGSGSA